MANKKPTSDYSTITRQLRDECKKIIAREDVKLVIGWEQGSYGFRVSPSFAESEEDIEKFIWSQFCINNLSVYTTLEEKLPLPRGVDPDTRKTALVVKGCDSRALVQMVVESFDIQNQLVIIGIPCYGIIDYKKLEPLLESKDALDAAYGNGYEVLEQGEYFIININGEEYTFARSDIMYDKCNTCRFHVPVVHDVMVGEERPGFESEPDKRERVTELEARSTEDKWAYWQDKFDRCIRCYACRNICPVCYCKECIADTWQPQWIRRSVNVSENTMFHVMRAFHLAGRCIECGECERACPMDIPLMELNKKMAKDVKELFDYEAGVDIELKPLLAAFKPDDPEEFVL
jgi:ferredoxin